MKISKQDKENIQKVIDGILIDCVLPMYPLRDLEEYFEKLGIEYIDDSSYKHLYTIRYIQKDTKAVFYLNGKEQQNIQTFYKDV
jgi:hypothetical protein